MNNLTWEEAVDSAYGYDEDVTIVNRKTGERLTGWLDEIERNEDDSEFFYVLYVPDMHGEGDGYPMSEWEMEKAT